jgi:hypothetical protein
MHRAIGFSALLLFAVAGLAREAAALPDVVPEITASGKGASLGMPALSLAGQVTVRLKRSGGPACWQARYPTAQRNDATQ